MACKHWWCFQGAALTPSRPTSDFLLPRPIPQPGSCDKKLLQLGWQEKTSWEEGLRKTVDWYLNHATRDYWCAC